VAAERQEDDRDPVGADVARTLAIASRVVERSLGEMSLPQLRILSLVERAPERASRLASQSDVSRPTLTGVLDGLVAKGWVERVEVEGDRRGVQLTATRSGRRALAVAQNTVAARLDEILDHLDATRRHEAVVGLEALGEALHAHMRDRMASRP
jgi:long-chain acyl-CoA synthetase